MKLFKCKNCNLVLFFDNRSCQGCGYVLGYDPLQNGLCTLVPSGNDTWQILGDANNSFKFCANAQQDTCNWLVDANSPERFCVACRHNRTVPDLSDQENMKNWRKMELAKHRMFYTLLRFGLPLPTRSEDPKRGLAFDFLADTSDAENVLTGHDEGIITVALKEADDAEREARRTKMGELYRTLLGHFRHEIGHYYWDRLVDDTGRQEECRAVFGDERLDYEETLKRYYNEGAPPNWQDNYISAYATSHPWEDFAETWAHYLHIIDSLETASAFSLSVSPAITTDQHFHASAPVDAYNCNDFQQLVQIWLPLTYALNAMNSSMGRNSLYPFVITPQVITKLTFIHALLQGQ